MRFPRQGRHFPISHEMKDTSHKGFDSSASEIHKTLEPILGT